MWFMVEVVLLVVFIVTMFWLSATPQERRAIRPGPTTSTASDDIHALALAAGVADLPRHMWAPLVAARERYLLTPDADAIDFCLSVERIPLDARHIPGGPCALERAVHESGLGVACDRCWRYRRRKSLTKPDAG